MKKISKKEITRIKNKLEEQSMLEYLVPIFGTATLIFFGLARIGNNLFGLGLAAEMFVLFILSILGLNKYTLTPEEREKYKKFQAFEEAKVHKEALDTYNKLSKVFN